MVVKYPWKRDELFYYLTLLSDAAAARRVWVEKQFPAGVKYDCFDYAVNFLFDDNGFVDMPEKTMGAIVEDEAEMRTVTAVIKAVDQVLKVHSTNLTDEQYINTPEWAQVVESAKTALEVLAKKPVSGD